ncbi:PepSY domain-containing protein [Neisseria sp. CCUG12390]|uniref:PepSY domain-containing protein n=1 Tax=Neisseria sp. CCUG12390 TaxID=3392035 RepID=UPI003A1015F8
MKLHTFALLMIAASLGTGSFSALAAPKKERSVSRAKAVQIAKKRVGGGRVTDVEHSDGRWEIEIRRGCTEYDVDISSRSGRVVKVDTENRCDD